MVKTLKGISVKFVLILVVFISFNCKQEVKQSVGQDEVETPEYYTEDYRPQFHFTPEEKWMNDPNGLVYNNGVYHLFYQYHPDSTVWGPMHWGHAVSEDMMKWHHKPVALFPDEHGFIFSGSAVIDQNNTAGFGTDDNPAMVAIFTYHNMAGEQAGTKDFQTQGIAYSLDNGDSWTKYEGNPVVENTGIKDFRDPKVFWNEQEKNWTMLLVAGDHLQIWSSPNLKTWKKVSEFGKDTGAHGGVWECPDLFPLKIEGSDEVKWVLLISINPGAPNGGSGTQYFIGDFDGKTFTTDQTENRWIDLGRDNYAGVTYNEAPNNERIFIGWMSNWDYAGDTPTEKWRSAMTVPRELTLRKVGDDVSLFNYPVTAFEKYVALAYPESELQIQPDRKSLMVHYFKATQGDITPDNFTDFIIGYYNNLTNALANKAIQSNTDALDAQIEKIEWIKEWVRVAMAYQKDNNTYSQAQNRFYGGEMSCAGQLYSPMVGLIAKTPLEAYQKAYDLSLFDIGYAKDITALVSTMTHMAMRTQDLDSIMNAPKFVDPVGYADSRLVGRIPTVILDDAQQNVRLINELILDTIFIKDTLIYKVPNGFSGSKQDWVRQEMIYELLEEEERNIAFHSAEIWQILVTALEFGQGNFEKTMQFIVNYGRDNDTVAAVAGMILGAKLGYKALPPQWRETVLRVNRENIDIDLEALAQEMVP
jgi:fructan beta-fructosidase